ncbi:MULTISPECIES: muconate/chloromuconate family cycloisomerase [unclassified Sphingomonas]|jgi:muconate cycloisomerase|uniref:muconate/chloromuconate family cycloisomerase n=1 Tax=unclassified Sphingomonas TaxID=196159 RepID=UPI00161AE7DC|nr:muconate/chloromuconate family cycloisomerase [Sphingomonas sp. BK481]MBB3588636.1 muconate cycloisomerase [Sphingomonas sp. BK481]
MVTIAEIDTFIVDIPTIRPHVLAMATIHHQSIVLVRMRDSDGLEGIGEGTTIGGLSYGEESPEGIKLAIDSYIAPVLRTCDPTRVGAAMAKVTQSVFGNHIAKCAVETALLDLAGKRLGVPVSELIGGGRVRDSLPVAWTLASGDTARDIEEAERVLDLRRHNIFKLKIGKRSVRDDVSHVAAIKKAVGDRGSVRVDVNQNWDEAQADLGMRLLQDAGVDLVEQPVARHAHASMARLSAKHIVPLMADEALHGPCDAFAIAACSGARIFAVKIAQSGGLLPAHAVATIAHAGGVGLYGGTMLEGGVGTAASAHLCATLPTLAWGTELFGPLLLAQDILAEPLRYADFELAVPTGPGLGVALDEDRVAFHRRDRTAPTLHVVAERA